MFYIWILILSLHYRYKLNIQLIGLSFLFPNLCISEAKTKLLESIKFTNENIFYKRKLKLSYQQKCSTSWLQIDILDKEEGLLNEEKNSIVGIKKHDNSPA